MSWMALLAVGYLWLGLRRRDASVGVPLLTMTTVVLVVVYLFVLK